MFTFEKNKAELVWYYGKHKTPREMKDQIMALLGEWKDKRPPELGKAAPSRYSVCSSSTSTLR